MIDKKKRKIIYLLSIASLLLIPIVAVMKLVEGTEETMLLIDQRDPDAIISCDDEICKHDLKIAEMDETLNLNNSTSLLVFPKTH